MNTTSLWRNMVAGGSIMLLEAWDKGASQQPFPFKEPLLPPLQQNKTRQATQKNTFLNMCVKYFFMKASRSTKKTFFFLRF